MSFHLKQGRYNTQSPLPNNNGTALKNTPEWGKDSNDKTGMESGDQEFYSAPEAGEASDSQPVGQEMVPYHPPAVKQVGRGLNLRHTSDRKGQPISPRIEKGAVVSEPWNLGRAQEGMKGTDRNQGNLLENQDEFLGFDGDLDGMEELKPTE